MKKSGVATAKSKPFNWSKVSSGKIRSGVDRTPTSDLLFDRTGKFSDSSDESDWNVGSRQRALLSSSRQVTTRENSSKSGNSVFESRQWLRSARQRELIRSNSGSNLLELRQEHVKSGLRKEWASTAKQRLRCAPILNNSSAGTLDLALKESSHDSAGNLGRSGSGADLLVEAVRYCRTRHIKLLLDGGTDPNALDSEGVTALIASVADIDDSSVQNRLMHILLDANADPNVGDCEGTTPLMHASSINCHDAAVILLQNEKTDCGIQDNNGLSALMYASSKGFANIVLLILAAFKKIHHVTYLSQRNVRGLSACDLAEENEHFHIVSLLKTDSELVPFSNPERRHFFNTHTHELSRTPTPTDENVYSSLECLASNFVDDQTFRPPTPVSDLDSLNCFDPSSATPEFDNFINCFADSASIDSGNEADTESLMDGDVSLSEIKSIMASPVVRSPNSALGSDVSISPIDSPKSNQSMKLIVDRNTIEKIKSITNNPKSSTLVLNPLKNVIPIPYGTGDGMPKIDLTISNRSLNRSIKNLAQEEYESKPSNRPPTPARPSLPNLILDSSISDASTSFNNSSSEISSGGRTRRITIGSFARSTSEPKTMSLSPPNRISQEEEEISTDILDVSTKSEGWDALWGPRGKGLSSAAEGHVVTLPPIGNYKSLSRKERKNIGQTNMLNVAKKTLDRLDNALATSKTKQRKSRSLPRSRNIENVDLSS